MYEKKYKKGREIRSFEALMYFLDKDNFIYINHKILHKGWILSLRFRYLRHAIECGQISMAIKLPHITQNDHRVSGG